MANLERVPATGALIVALAQVKDGLFSRARLRHPAVMLVGGGRAGGQHAFSPAVRGAARKSVS
jgi:hypothetical protein